MIKMNVLSPQRIKILNLLAEGKTYDQIAREMFLSSRTIEIHIRILRKHFEAPNVAALMIQAVRHNLIHSISCPTLNQESK